VILEGKQLVILINEFTGYDQGRRKHQKVGGGGAPISRGTFGMKRAPKKFFSEILASGRGLRRENKCNHKSKAIEADSRMRSNESDRKN
jgi:hypothetical protein